MNVFERAVPFLLLGLLVSGCGGGTPAPAAPPGVSAEDQTNIGVAPEPGKKKK